MPLGTCLSCGLGIELSTESNLGLRVKCHQCGTKLELVWLDPIELDWLFDENEAEINENDDFEELGEYGDYEEFDENDA